MECLQKNDKDDVGNIYVNGVRILDRVQLQPFDRIIFGHSAIFMYLIDFSVRFA